MAKDNTAPKHTGSSKKRYLDSLAWRLPQNKARRAKRHAHRMERQQAKVLKRPHGYARALRRSDIHRFQQERKDRQKLTGTIKVNAPSLQLLGQYIGRAS